MRPQQLTVGGWGGSWRRQDAVSVPAVTGCPLPSPPPALAMPSRGDSRKPTSQHTPGRNSQQTGVRSGCAERGLFLLRSVLGSTGSILALLGCRPPWACLCPLRLFHLGLLLQSWHLHKTGQVTLSQVVPVRTPRACLCPSCHLHSGLLGRLRQADCGVGGARGEWETESLPPPLLSPAPLV